MKNSKIEIIIIIERLTDILVMLLSYALANKIKFGFFRTGIINPNNMYMTIFELIVIAYFLTTFIIRDEKSFVDRSIIEEIVVVVKKHIYMIAIVTLYLYATKTGSFYSRGQMGIFFITDIVVMVIERKILKRIFTKNYHRSKSNERILLITTSDKVEQFVKKIKETRNWYFRISYIAIVDTDMTGSIISNIDVTASKDNLLESIATSSIDSVLICADEYRSSEFIDSICNMGKKVHISIDEYSLSDNPHSLDMLGNLAIVTYIDTMNNTRQLFVKRLFDIILGILGVVCFVFASAIISIGRIVERDTGHSVLSYTRVGKNGRDFKMYRFRTMYLYPEKHKSKYSMTGKAIHLLHLENLPQAWNVLMGEMSFIGPKPLTFEEFLNYPYNYRKVIKMKPGIIGYWNTVNKKEHNNTMDKDLKYANEWNIKLDIILFLESLHFLFARTENSFERYELLQIKECIENETPYAYEDNYVPNKKNYLYLFIKRSFDIVASSIGIIVLLPIFLIFAFLVHWEDGGSPIYGHTRIGFKGKKIKILKFRSMKMQLRDLEKILTPEQLEQYRKEFKIDNDPRITKIGNILRKTSVDELPQLFNILKGDISIVGPRPIVEKELAMYYRENESKLLSVKPGLTGYWQAYARNNATYESGERQRMEMHYVENASLLFDIKILFRTVYAVLKRDGAQ